MITTGAAEVGDLTPLYLQLVLSALHYTLPIEQETKGSAWSYDRLANWTSAVTDPLSVGPLSRQAIVLNAPGVEQAVQAIVFCLLWYFSRPTPYAQCIELVKAQCGSGTNLEYGPGMLFSPALCVAGGFSVKA